MFRSISTKLVATVLAAVILPVSGLAMLIEYRVADRLMLELVRQSLKGLAGDLAEQVNNELAEHRSDIAVWATEPTQEWALDEHEREQVALRQTVERAPSWGRAQVLAHGRGESSPDLSSEGNLFRSAQTQSFNRYVRNKPEVELLLLIDADGRLVTCNSRDSEGRALSERMVDDLFDRQWASPPWFARTIAEREAAYNQHVPGWIEGQVDPDDYRVGVSHRVDSATFGQRAGVLYASLNWSAFDGLVSSSVVQDTLRGLDPAGEVLSPYAWIWDADADTILAHRDPDLYQASLAAKGLSQMAEDALASKRGLHREYEFKGVRKNAAFCHAAEPEEGGFGWIVGVGINNGDIYAATTTLRQELFQYTLVLSLTGVLIVLVIARRTTAPILALEEHTRRVSEGDLEAKISIPSRDEVGRLAEAFNAMTSDLADQREQLVRAEKDAAWREMARQIAHDIKNPLTPIQLSLDLLDRARADGSKDADAILERTTAMMRRQVESLRGIANDFYEFTGGREAAPEAVPFDQLCREVYELHRAWAGEQRVELAFEVVGEGPFAVWADREKLRRVLTNLVSNALQAMPDGGRLEGRLEFDAQGGGVALELRDTGEGLTKESRAHLFEPYFTTKSEGTGLGLAISRRVVDEAGGGITLEPAPDDGRGGAIARVWLPEPPIEDRG
ncbi:MAG: ATP-binding protein [Planctomycetota bacterium]